MFLQNIKLSNFRNFHTLDFSFQSPVSVLVGDNAQGKSSFLEAIYYLALTKSLKAEKDEEVIKIGEAVCRLEGLVQRENSETNNLEIVMQLQEGVLSKRVKVNGIPRRVLDYIGFLHAVLFAPEDINLVSGPPSLRRWHVDITLAPIDREYKKALTQYGDIITRRNRVLRNIQEGLAALEELDYWSGQMLLLGNIITQKRREFFTFLNKQERKFGEFSLKYLESGLTASRMQEYQPREIAAASSLIGPHRDDFHFFLEDKDLAKYGSRGETRTAVLDLKVAEAGFIEARTGERPLLLLDDVFSELDLKHREHVLDLVSMQQTVIAAVELDDYLTVFFEENGKIYEVKEGTVSSRY